MLREIIDFIDDDFLKKDINGFQMSKLIYHPMYWMHKHLTFDDSFCLPGFHTDNLHDFEKRNTDLPSKEELRSYLERIEENVIIQIMNTDPSTIVIGTVTVLDKIIGQVRHTCHHIGMLHLLIFQERNVWLKYIGPDFT